jgi:hypothetical protein
MSDTLASVVSRTSQLFVTDAEDREREREREREGERERRVSSNDTWMAGE